MPAEAHNVPVFKGGQFLVARFDCPPACPAWSSENRISGGVVLAFPRAPVGIRHEGGRRLVADRTSVMLYNPGQRYRRELLDGRGDNCYFMVLPPALMGEALGEFDPGAGDRSDRPLVSPRAPCSREAADALARLLAAAPADALEAEAQGMRLVRAVASAAGGEGGVGPTGVRARTAAHHADLVEHARLVLARSPGQNLTLAEVARAVHSSPYHLARVFRAHTGRSIGQYRAELRVREAAAALADGRQTLAAIAYALGYASHAHFTTAFTRAMGVTPSGFRAGLAASRRFRTIVKDARRTR